MTHAQNPLRGIALMALAIFMFSMMDALAKELLQRYAAPQVVWARFIGQLLATLLVLRGASLRHLKSAHPVLHLWRALFQLGAIGFFFFALTRIGLAEATAIFDVAPVLITLGAALFLAEGLGPRRIIGVALALIGMLIIIRPGSDAFTPWAVLPLLGAICYAGNALLTRHIGPSEPVWTTILIAGILCTLITSAALPFFWRPIALADLPLFAAIGLIGTIGQLCLVRAFSIAEAGLLAPFSYLGTVFALFWGIALFQERPDAWTLVGALVIVGAGLYVWHREMRTRAARGEDATRTDG